MVTAAGMLVVALVAIVGLLLQARQYAAERERAERAWADERRELLNRVQAPHFMPTAPQYLEVPEQAPDEWSVVGTIRNDPELYLREDDQ